MSSQGFKPRDFASHPRGERLGEPVEPVDPPVIGMTNKIEAAGEAELFAQDLHQTGGGGQGEIMHDRHPCPVPHPVELDRNRIGGKRHQIEVPEDDYMELSTLDGCVTYLHPKFDAKASA